MSGAFITLPEEKIFIDEIKELELFPLSSPLRDGGHFATDCEQERRRLFRMKSQLRRADEQLEVVKEKFLERLVVCDEQQAELDRRRKEIKDEAQKFRKFIEENDRKKEAAGALAVAERRRLEHKIDELGKCVKVLQERKHKRSEIGTDLTKQLKYRDYMELVVEAAAHDGIVRGEDMLKKWEILRNVNAELVLQMRSVGDGKEEANEKIRALADEGSNSKFVQNAEVHELRHRLVALLLSNQNLGTDAGNDAERSAGVRRETAQISTTVRDVYARCCAVSFIAMPQLGDGHGATAWLEELKCLDYLANKIVDWNEIIEIFDSES